jgi:hypothetical protein
LKCFSGWVYRPQPKRKRSDLSANPLWARYMHGPNQDVLYRSSLSPAVVGCPSVNSIPSAVTISGARIDKSKLGKAIMITAYKYSCYTIANAGLSLRQNIMGIVHLKLLSSIQEEILIHLEVHQFQSNIIISISK